jgi:Skp family chaperone for outer membrane proteins
MRFAVSTTLMAGVLFGATVMPAAAQQASLPFPSGVKYAYVDLARILGESVHGQTANAQVQQLTEQKRNEIEARQATLQTQIDSKNQNLLQLQQRLAQGETVMSTEARLSLSREIGRLQREIQRDTEDAQAEMQRVTQDADAELTELTQRLQVEFDSMLSPALESVAIDRGVDLIFNVGQGGLVWANRALDLTQVVVDNLNRR